MKNITDTIGKISQKYEKFNQFQQQLQEHQFKNPFDFIEMRRDKSIDDKMKMI